MKAKLLVGWLGIMLSQLVFAQTSYYSYQAATPAQSKTIYTPIPSATTPVYQKTSCSAGGCGQASYCFGGCSGVTCDCTDPSCSSGAPCLDPCQCCRAFGNIGSGDFSPIDSGDP